MTKSGSGSTIAPSRQTWVLMWLAAYKDSCWKVQGSEILPEALRKDGESWLMREHWAFWAFPVWHLLVCPSCNAKQAVSAMEVTCNGSQCSQQLSAKPFHIRLRVVVRSSSAAAHGKLFILFIFCLVSSSFGTKRKTVSKDLSVLSRLWIHIA